MKIDLNVNAILNRVITAAAIIAMTAGIGTYYRVDSMSEEVDKINNLDNRITRMESQIKRLKRDVRNLQKSDTGGFLVPEYVDSLPDCWPDCMGDRLRQRKNTLPDWRCGRSMVFCPKQIPG